MAVAPSVPGAAAGPREPRSGVAATSVAVEPDLEQARELAREHNLIPLRYSFIEDCETPVSAFLKLRALAPGEPAFLLESADQGQRVGRWSFIGFRPRACCAGRSPTAATPTRSRRATCSASRRRRSPTRRRSPAARSASSATTSCARSSRSAIRRRDPLGLPDMALMLSDALVVFDHLKHTVTILANADLAGRARHRARATQGAPPRSSEVRERARRARAPRRPSRRRRAAAAVSVEHAARAVRSDGGADRPTTSTPATPSRWCPPSAGRRPCRWRRSRSTAACARSTRAPTCTSWTSATSRSPARAPSRC